MFGDAFNLIVTAWNGTIDKIWSIFDALGAWNYVLGVIFTMLIVRNVVYPLMKAGVASAGSSDRARYSREDEE